MGKDAVELAAPLFRISAMAGDTDGMYSYGKLLETGWSKKSMKKLKLYVP